MLRDSDLDVMTAPVWDSPVLRDRFLALSLEEPTDPKARRVDLSFSSPVARRRLQVGLSLPNDP